MTVGNRYLCKDTIINLCNTQADKQPNSNLLLFGRRKGDVLAKASKSMAKSHQIAFLEV
jgi:hypothetical protein